MTTDVPDPEHGQPEGGVAPPVEPSAAQPEPWLSTRTQARLAFAGKALVLTSLLASAGLLILRAQRHKSTQPEHRVDLAVWELLKRPAWSSLDDVGDVRRASGLVGLGLPLYDRSAAEIARAALDGTPRAKRVVSIRRRPPNQIDVVFELRRPIAAVALPDGRYVEVDDEGVVLHEPSATRPVREAVALRVVSGALDPVPPPGGTCSDDIRDGLRLCRLLDGYRDGLGAQVLRTFDEVDVSNHGGRLDPAASELLLRAAPLVGGADAERPIACAVEWGQLGTEYGEPDFETKASKLEGAVRTFGDFAGIERVRVAYAELSFFRTNSPESRWLRTLSEQPQGR